jgi:hypothetical protein
VDVGDESSGTEQVNSLGDVLRLGDTLDELRNEALDILVGDQGAENLHGAVGSLLDFRLGVPHGSRDDGDQVGDAEGHLCGGALGEGLDALEVAHLFGPFLCVLERVDDVRDDGLDGVGVCGRDNSLGGSLGGDLDASDLVTDSGQHVGQKGDEVGLNSGRDVGVLGDGADSVEGTLAGDGILLAGELLLQHLDSPGKSVSNSAMAGEGQSRVSTYLVGASASSMSPLMKVAMA